MNFTSPISVIIPVAKDETEHRGLVKFFETLSDPQIEVITASGNSRANALNNGAKKAIGDFLWFIHADTKIQPVHIEKLKSTLEKSPNKIHYFDLAFEQTAPVYMRLNAFGANMRSRLGFPWGDQTYCIKKENLAKIGYFDESLSYGEDHALILKSRMMNIKLNRIPHKVITSAREYKNSGWLRLTLQRQCIWPILTIKLWRKYSKEYRAK